MTLSVYHTVLGPNTSGGLATSESWEISSNGGPSTAKKQYRVKWADQWLTRRQLVGYSYPAVGPDGFRRLRREAPELLSPWAPEYYCTSAQVVGYEGWTGRACYDRSTYAMLPGYPNVIPTKGGEDGLQPTTNFWKENQYKFAVIEATFSAADFVFATDDQIDQPPFNSNEFWRFVSYRDDRTAKAASLQGGMMYFIEPVPGGGTVQEANARRVVPFAVPVLEAKKTLYLTWHDVDVDAFPTGSVDLLIGKVNKTTFLNRQPGTLLFMPPRITRAVNAAGRIALTAEFVLEFFAKGQNKILYSKPGQPIEYRWLVSDPAITAEPVAGNLPVPQKTLYAEGEFLDAFNCSLN